MRKVAVALAAGLLLIMSGVALASIPDSSGVIHGCYKTNNPNRGAVVVIDIDAGQSCPSGYTALNWSQTGPPGPQGPSGVSGIEVLSSEIHTDTGSATKATTCPDGKFAVSGGYKYIADDGSTNFTISVQKDQPFTTPPTLAQGWWVTVVASTPGTLTTYAYCLTRP